MNAHSSHGTYSKRRKSIDVITKNKWLKFLGGSNTNKSIAGLVVLAIGISGYLLITGRAGGFFASFEPDNGTLSGNAQLVTDSSASGGKAVQFTAPVSPPPPTGEQSCPAYPAFPDANCTGVPAGTVLGTYSGPCTITTPNTIIDAKTINCDVTIAANNVTIKRSKVNGAIDSGGAAYHFEVIDSEVDGTPGGPQQITSIGGQNFLLLRVEVTGGSRSVLCEHDCEVRDSWLHGQEMPDNVDWHLSAVRLSQRSRVIHNTLSCDKAPNNVDGGCSANQTGYPDFEITKDWLMEKNLLKGNPGVAYCSYGGAAMGKPYSNDPNNATYVVYKDNVFERGPTGHCGAYGPITTFDSTRIG